MNSQPVFCQESIVQEVRIGVLAKRGSERCLKKWGPTADFLSREIPGKTFAIVPLNFEQIIPATSSQGIDFILANSVFYVQLEARYRVRRIVTLKNRLGDQAFTTFGGVIFCRADRGDINTIDDLREKTFAAVEPSSFGGWHAAWRELNAGNIDPKRDFLNLAFLGTHDRVVHAVLSGSADAGTVRTDTLERMALEGKIDLQEIKVISAAFDQDEDFPFLLSTRLYPEWPLAALSHVSEDLVEEVASNLLAMPPDDPAARASRSLGWTIPLNYRSVHECAQELGIGIYARDEEVQFGEFFRAHRWWFAGIAVVFMAILIVAVAFGRKNRILLSVRSNLRNELLQRKRAQAALQKSEHLYRGLVERAADAIFILDLGGYFTEANEAVTRQTGFDQKEVIGRHFQSSFDPADRDEAQKAFDTCLEGESVEFDCRIQRKDTNSAWFSLGIQPIFDMDGNVVGIQGISHNIQERKQTEHRKHRERELLLSAIEQAGETVVITDASGNIEYVNPAFEEVTGFSKSEAIGQNPRVLNSHHHDNAFFSDLWDTVTSGSTWRGRIVNRRKDGTTFTEDVVISPIRHEEGQITHFVAVKRDISHEIELESQLRQAQKMEAVGQLAAGVAHDFNNLLQVIGGHVDLMLMTLESDDPKRDDIESVRGATDRAADLTRQLLAFSRQQWIQPIELNLNRLIADLMKLLRRVIGADVDLQVIPASGLGIIRADPGQIEQVLVNLCINARDAMPDGGTLAIQTENVPNTGAAPDDLQELKLGPCVCLSVSDTGSGIDSQTLEHIFEPFFTTKARGQGTGLGLATVYGIVQQHGGTIHVDSEPGTGSVFRVFLPIVEPETNEKDRSVNPHDDEIRGHEGILIAEDEDGVRDLAKRVLEQHGYRTLPASDGEEALRVFEDHSEEIQLALLDIVMPKMGGWDVLEKLREKEPNLPILLTTGHRRESTGSESRLGDGVYLLRKPYRIHDLLKKVREVLDR